MSSSNNYSRREIELLAVCSDCHAAETVWGIIKKTEKKLFLKETSFFVQDMEGLRHKCGGELKLFGGVYPIVNVDVFVVL